MQPIASERLVMRAIFERSCGNCPTWCKLPEETRETFIRRMERSCFERTINECIVDGIDRLWTERKFAARYSSECYRIITNLDCAGQIGSDYFIEAICAGTINPNDVASLTSYDLNPMASGAEREEIAIRLQQKIDKKTCTNYYCSKCGLNKTTVIEYMGRAADEPVKRSIRCVNCGHVWRN